ncbi:MAG: 16S rRNA (uracil(1498)-N(3))-methyltransferase [Chromatiales bacterium]|jgi:16S rRNA (uracil1498-N3)-methyltransferase
MRIPRIYTEQPLSEQQQLRLDTAASHYLVQVLRLREQAELILFNGDGYDYPAQLLDANKKQTLVSIGQRSDIEALPTLPIHLGLGISKGERLEYALQKAVELGVTEISLLDTEFNAVKLPPERLQKKMTHWQKIMIAACEQSGRKRLPQLHALQPLQQWINQADAELKLMLHPTANRRLMDYGKPASVCLLIGPEGGFSEQEIRQAQQQDFQPLRLGRFVLRTETAPLAAIAAVQTLWGDFTSQ